MKLAVLLFTLLLLSLPQQTYAEQGSDSGSSQDNSGKKDRIKEQVELRKDKLREAKEDFKDKKQSLQADFKERREALKEEFKEKLNLLKDERKKMLAEKIDAKLDTINENRTERMTERLAKLQEILVKLEEKRDAAQTAGQNVSAVNAAIAAAETAITAAETAITAQAAKDYTAEITGESTLRQNFGQVVSQLRTDLTATHKTVVDAKQAVKDVAKALRQLEPTVSVTVSVTP